MHCSECVSGAAGVKGKELCGVGEEGRRGGRRGVRWLLLLMLLEKGGRVGEGGD